MISFLKSKKTRTIAFASVALLTILTVGATLAYYVQDTPPVVNTFEAGTIDTDITEKVHGLTKEITVTNTSGVPCLVRIRVTATPEEYLQLKEGNPVIVEIADGKDAWIDGKDGFYYYNGILNGSSNTNVNGKESFSVEYETTETFEELSKEEKTAVAETVRVNIYQEAIQTSAGELSAIGPNGEYNHEVAMQLWAQYNAAQNADNQ